MARPICSSLLAVAGQSQCWFLGLTAVPWPQGGQGPTAAASASPLPGGSLALKIMTSVDLRAGRLYDTPEISAKEWNLWHKPTLFCAALMPCWVLPAPSGVPAQEHPPLEQHLAAAGAERGIPAGSSLPWTLPAPVGLTVATPMVDARAGTGPSFPGSRSQVCRVWGMYGGGDTGSHRF